MGKEDRNWVKKGLTGLDKELGVHSEGDGKPFQGFELGGGGGGGLWPGLCSIKLL